MELLNSQNYLSERLNDPRDVVSVQKGALGLERPIYPKRLLRNGLQVGELEYDAELVRFLEGLIVLRQLCIYHNRVRPGQHLDGIRNVSHLFMDKYPIRAPCVSLHNANCVIYSISL